MLLFLSLGKIKKTCLDPLAPPTVTPFLLPFTEKLLERGVHSAVSISLFLLPPERFCPTLHKTAVTAMSLKPVEMLAAALDTGHPRSEGPGLGPFFLHVPMASASLSLLASTPSLCANDSDSPQYSAPSRF